MKKQRIGQEQIIFFDGTCSLCAKSIDILRSRDKRGQFNFLAFQYEVARDIIRCHSEHTTFADKSVSLVYLRNGQVKLRSTAVLCILQDLGGIYRLSTLFYLIPVFIRDFVYDQVAKRRYKWFGKCDIYRDPQSD